MREIQYVDTVEISGKIILLRVDFNVSLNPDSTIANDERIRQSLDTIRFLLSKGNKLIILSHLGQPKAFDSTLTLVNVAKRLSELVEEPVTFLPYEHIKDLKPETRDQFGDARILLLDNIRFFAGEKKNDMQFAANLAKLADVFVNDAFGVSHRPDASVVGLPKLLPHFGGLLLKREVEMIGKVISGAEHPIVAIIGGAKISSKIGLIDKLLDIADNLIVGGGIANTFLAAQGYNVGNSLCENEALDQARRLMYSAAQKNTSILLPTDAACANSKDSRESTTYKVDEIPKDMSIFDIGPDSEARFGAVLARAKTIVWNGPVGYFENSTFRQGSDFIYYAIAHNPDALSVVGGGDTLAAISDKKYLEKITHISTGGGAMLEFIEKGTLPGIEALKS